jgi:hypothetical protein
MSRPLTNKQLVVLGVVRSNPTGLEAKRVADLVRAESPLRHCEYCDGTGERNFPGYQCAPCGGQGERHAHFSYAEAYQALQRLRKVGLIARRCKRDEWGDEVPVHIYFALAVPDPTDPLEQAFALPSSDAGDGR